MLASEEAIAQAAIGSKGHFPGPLFLALPPLEIEWHYRMQMAAQARARQRCRLSRPDAGRARAAILIDLRDPEIRHYRRTPGRAFRHRRLADLAHHSLRVRRHRDPARRRGDPPRRMQGGACGRRRRFADAGVAGALLAAVGAVDAERSARAGVKAVLEEPRRLRAGRRRRRAGAGGLRLRHRPRRQGARHPRRLRREVGFVSPHPVEPRRQAGHRLHAHRAGRRRRRPGRYRLHQRAWHLDAGERQDGMPRRLHRVRRAHPQHSDVVEQIDDRPYPDRRRRRGSGIQPLDARAPAHPADHQPSRAGSGDPARRRAECRARCAHQSRHLQFVRLRRPKYLAWCWRGSRRDRHRGIHDSRRSRPPRSAQDDACAHAGLRPQDRR